MRFSEKNHQIDDVVPVVRTM